MSLDKKQNFQISRFWAGSIPFEKSLSLQEKLKLSAKKSQFCFFAFESSQPVITMGLRSDKSHIFWSEEKLKKHNILQKEIRRGGEATLHSPGQLVIYPVLHLPSMGLKVRDWIKALENITKDLFKDLGIEVWSEGKYAGLYTKKGKIAFFGIHISEGVNQHGLSINVDNDLSLFQSIKSCGEERRIHDSLSFYPDFSLNKRDLFFKWCDKALEFLNRLRPLQKLDIELFKLAKV